MDTSAYQHINIRMSTRGKRPLRNLTPSDKVRAIQRIHNGETKASVSRDIGVPESTLRGWCKNEQKLRFMCRQLAATDQIAPIPGIDNPPEKRSRFDNHIQTTKYPATSIFDEFGYNRLSLNGLSFPSNGGNAILEKIELNEMIKKHMLLADSTDKQRFDNISPQMFSMMGGDYNSQLSIMQNLNLLSLLSPNLLATSNFKANGNESLDTANNKTSLGITDENKDITHCNISTNNKDSNVNNNQNYCKNNTASFAVGNCAKETGGGKWLYLTNQNTSTETNNDNIEANPSLNDSKNKRVKDKNNFFVIENYSDILNFLPVLPLGLLQIPTVNNRSDSECNNNTALIEWYKVFNASLNFLALAAAATALQPNSTISATNHIKNDNIFYKDHTKTANLLESGNNPAFFINNDVSNDSYFDSEPEDLSVRSATTSKISSSANSRAGSPSKSNGSFSPLQGD